MEVQALRHQIDSLGLAPYASHVAAEEENDQVSDHLPQIWGQEELSEARLQTPDYAWGNDWQLQNPQQGL